MRSPAGALCVQHRAVHGSSSDDPVSERFEPNRRHSPLGDPTHELPVQMDADTDAGSRAGARDRRVFANLNYTGRCIALRCMGSGVCMNRDCLGSHQDMHPRLNSVSNAMQATLSYMSNIVC